MLPWRMRNEHWHIGTESQQIREVYCAPWCKPFVEACSLTLQYGKEKPRIADTIEASALSACPNRMDRPLLKIKVRFLRIQGRANPEKDFSEGISSSRKAVGSSPGVLEYLAVVGPPTSISSSCWRLPALRRYINAATSGSVLFQIAPPYPKLKPPH